MEPRNTEQRWRRRFFIAWTVIGFALIFAAGFWLVGRISGALTPFVLAFVIVLVLRGPVNRFQSAGVKRGVAVLLCYLIAAVALVAVGSLLFPPLFAQIGDLAQEAPRYYRTVGGFFGDMLDRYQSMRLPDWVETAAANASERVGAQLVAWSTAITAFLVATGSGLVGLVVDSVLALVVAFFLLRDLPVMREELLGVFSDDREAEARVIYVKVITVLGGFLRGQFIIAIIVGLLTTIGLAIIGVPYALLLGLITGVFNVIPYFGPIVGGVLATFAAALAAAQGASPWLILGAPLLIFAVQQIDSTVLSPRIMSEQVDLHPVLVIFSLLVGGTLFGFIGLLLAIPFAAVIKGLSVYYYEKHTSSSLGTESGALFRQGKRGRPAGRDAADEDETSDDDTGGPTRGAGEERD